MPARRHAAAIWRRWLDSRRCLPELPSMLLVFTALVWLWPSINQTLPLDGGLTLTDQAWRTARASSPEFADD